jgi:hypothetical protein
MRTSPAKSTKGLEGGPSALVEGRPLKGGTTSGEHFQVYGAATPPDPLVVPYVTLVVGRASGCRRPRWVASTKAANKGRDLRLE